jgi:hypothetical protein
MTMDHRSTRAQDLALSDDDQGKPDWHNPVMEPRRPAKSAGHRGSISGGTYSARRRL